MTVVNGSLAAVNEVPTEGTLTVRSLTLRPGGTWAVTGEPKTVPIRAGKFTVDLIPGRTQFTVAGDGVSHDVTLDIPDEADAVEFVDLIEDNYEWEPPVVHAAQKAAREARESATAAANSAAIVGSAERVLEAESNSAQSATDAAAARDKALEHQNAAQKARTDAGTARNAAQDAQKEAENSQTAAADSATSANDSANRAGERARAADASATLAGEHAEQTTADVAASLEHRTMTGRARNTAEGYMNEAKSARDGAVTAAGAAGSSAQEAASDVRDELKDISDAAAGSAKAADSSAKEADNSAKDAEQSAQSAAEVVSSGVPDATGTIKGKLKLSGDLGGTADAPTVPGLSGKADTSHTHTVDQVSGLKATVDAVDAATHAATPSTLMRRGTSGAVSVGTPSSAVHAATKQYVDDRVDTTVQDMGDKIEARTPKVEVVSSLPANPDANTIYMVKE